MGHKTTFRNKKFVAKMCALIEKKFKQLGADQTITEPLCLIPNCWIKVDMQIMLNVQLILLSYLATSLLSRPVVAFKILSQFNFLSLQTVCCCVWGDPLFLFRRWIQCIFAVYSQNSNKKGIASYCLFKSVTLPKFAIFMVIAAGYESGKTIQEKIETSNLN